MSATLAAGRLAEEALRQIGAFSKHDTAADPVEHEIALRRLDLLVAELAGTERLWWLVPRNHRVVLAAGQRTYDLNGLIDPNLQFLERVYLVEGGRRRELDLVRRSEIDAVAPGTGRPALVHVDRGPKPVLTVHPTPAADGASLEIRGQSYSPDIAEGAGQVPHGFPDAWQRFLVLALAADLGAGPVRLIPVTEVERLERRAELARGRLLSFNNREQLTRPRFTRYRDF